MYFIKRACRVFTTCSKTTRISNISNFASKKMNAKPPNILIYTGNSCPKMFKNIEDNLTKCLKIDNYIVYHLLPSEINKDPWMENSLLLVVSSDTVDTSVANAFETYFKNYGNILFVCSKFNNFFLGNKCDERMNEECLVQVSYKDIGEAFIFRGKYSYYCNGACLCCDKNNKTLIWKITHNKNVLIMSEVYLERESNITHISSHYDIDKRLLVLKDVLDKEFGLKVKSDDFVPEVTPGYFFSDVRYEIVRIMKNLKIDNISSEKSVFYQCDFKYLDKPIKLPIYFYCEHSSAPLNFDKDLYFSNLHTDVYGHSVVYFPVVTTTMEVAKQLSDYEGIVIIAGYQVTGKARGTNKWISPVGCAMFTLHLTVPLSSHLGQKLTLLQHIAALAVVHGIKSQVLYKNLELKIKWPNDIYNNEIKIGGLIVASVIHKNSAHVNIGWGINVSNSCPTSCINDIIDNYNSKNSCSLPYLHTEEVVALTVSQMEFFVKDFIDNGSEKLLEHYYSYWMHSNKRVTLTSLNQQGTVIGLDEFGFLKVKTDSDKILVFQPDGNRFDITKNIIHSS